MFKLFIYIVIGLVLVSISYFGYKGLMNYKGYCFETKSYLSDEEKIDIAIRYLIDERKKRYLNANQNLVDFGSYFYLDSSDFLHDQPNCCKVAREFSSCNRGNCFTLSSLLGSHSGQVHIKYSNKVDNYKSKEVIAITNCGTPWDVFEALK